MLVKVYIHRITLAQDLNEERRGEGSLLDYGEMCSTSKIGLRSSLLKARKDCYYKAPCYLCLGARLLLRSNARAKEVKV